LIVISDFLELESLESALARARTQRQELSLLQILDPEELAPSVTGDVTLQAAESDEHLRVGLDEFSLKSYQRALQAELAELAALARRLSSGYVRLVSGQPLGPALRRFVSATVDAAQTRVDGAAMLLG
jgi:hypothetical protein